MPQFAFDGIFAPPSTAPPVPQRSSGAPFGDDLFDKHLSQARQLPEPYPIEPGSPPHKPPQCTTGPVQPDRRSLSIDDNKQAVADSPRTTNASREDQRNEDPSSTVGDHTTGAAAPTASQENSPTTEDEKKIETDDEPSTVVDQFDVESAAQHHAVAAALASAELAVKAVPAKGNVPHDELDDVPVNRLANKKVKRLDASSAKGQVAPVRREAESVDAKSAAATAPTEPVEKDANVAVDELAVESFPDAPAEKSSPQEASLLDTTEQETQARTAQDNAKANPFASASAARTPVAGNASDLPQADSQGNAEDGTGGTLDTGVEKPQSTTRRRDNQAAGTSEPTPRTMAEPAVEQPLAASEASAVIVENPTDSAATASKDTKSDAVGAIDAGKDSAGQNSPEQHTSHGRSQQPLDAARDIPVEQTTRPGAAHVRESEASAPRSQLLTDVERLRFVQRVARAIGNSATADGGQMRLRLSPPELGSLRMEIVVRQGTVTAHVEAETAAARDVLLDNLPALRERLAEQNIKLERFDVDLMRQSLDQTPQHTGGQDGDRAESSRRTNQTVSRETKPTAEQVALQTPVIQDGHVNVVI